MKLVLYSNKSLDDLENLTLNLFKDVSNKDVKLPDLSTPKPFDNRNLGKFIKLVPVKDSH